MHFLASFLNLQKFGMVLVELSRVMPPRVAGLARNTHALKLARPSLDVNDFSNLLPSFARP